MGRRWLIAVGYGVHGAGMVIGPDGYTSVSYGVLVDLAPMRLWDVGFLVVAGLCGVPAVPRALAVALLTGHTATWAAGLSAAQWVTHEGQSPTGPVVWLLLVALILYNAARPVDG